MTVWPPDSRSYTSLERYQAGAGAIGSNAQRTAARPRAPLHDTCDLRRVFRAPAGRDGAMMAG